MHQGALAVGSALAPLLVATLGEEGAVIAAGLLLPGVVALMGAKIRTVDRAAKVPHRELELIRSLDLFASLPAHSLEDLAGRFVPVSASPGEVVIKEGDVGDRFYVVKDGEAAVSQNGRPLTTLGPGSTSARSRSFIMCPAWPRSRRSPPRPSLRWTGRSSSRPSRATR